MSSRARIAVAWLMVALGVLVVAEPASRLVLADEPAGPAIASLGDAVALGVVDPALIDEVRASGETIGYVVLNVDAAIDALKRRFPDPADRRALLDALDAIIVAAKERLATALGDRAPVFEDYRMLTTIALRFRSEDALLAAARLPVVAGVFADKPPTALMSESRDLVRAPIAHAAGFRGQGTYVAVIDTGVDTTVDPRWFPSGSVPITHRVEGVDGSAMRTGHGTHVASTVLAIAPETRIISVEVFRWNPDLEEARGVRGGVAAAIAYVVSLKRAFLADSTQCCNVVAMNLSLGSGEYSLTACRGPYSLESAYLAGIVPVVAAGNDAVEEETRAFREGVDFPACDKDALSVGASTDGVFARVPARDPRFEVCEASPEVDRPTSFSQTGPPLWMLAPGNCIVAAGGASQGTSMAAPHVAGAVAVLFSANPDATVDEVWRAVTEAGPVITDSRPATPVARRRLDVAAAVERLLGDGVPPGDREIGVVRRVVLGRAEISVATRLQPGDAFDLGPIVVRNDGGLPESLRMSVAPAGVLATAPPASWLEFAPRDLVLAAGQTATVRGRIDLPPDAVPGTYVASVGPQRTVAGVALEPELAASLRLTFTVVEAENPIGGLFGWLGRLLAGSDLARFAFGGAMIIGAFRVTRPRPPSPAASAA